MPKELSSPYEVHNGFKISWDYHQMVARAIKAGYNRSQGEKMIAIDIHDTLGDYILAMCQRYGPPKQWPGDGHNTLDRMWPSVDMRAHFTPDNHGAFLSTVPVFLDAPNSVWRLRQMGFEFCYFTATPPMYRAAVTDWIGINLFPPAELRMADGWDNKGEALKKMEDITMLIDDSPATLLAAVDLGITVYVYDRPWNRDVTVGTRVVGWHHLLWQLGRDFLS